jgi:hypothetical protein
VHEAETRLQFLIVRDEGFPLGEQRRQTPDILERDRAVGLRKLPEFLRPAALLELVELLPLGGQVKDTLLEPRVGS